MERTCACPRRGPGSGLVARAFLGVLFPEPPLQSVRADGHRSGATPLERRAPPPASPPRALPSESPSSSACLAGSRAPPVCCCALSRGPAGPRPGTSHCACHCACLAPHPRVPEQTDGARRRGAELRAGRVRKGSTLRPAPGPGPLRTPHPGKAYGSLLPSSHSPAPRWPRLGPQHGTAACWAPLMPAWRDPGAAGQDGGAAQVKAPCHHRPPCQEPGGEQQPGRAWELLLEPP